MEPTLEEMLENTEEPLKGLMTEVYEICNEASTKIDGLKTYLVLISSVMDSDDSLMVNVFSQGTPSSVGGILYSRDILFMLPEKDLFELVNGVLKDDF